METSEKRTLISPVFKTSIIQMPSSQFLTGQENSGQIVRYSDHHSNNRLKFLGWQRCSNVSTAYFFMNFQKIFLFYLWVILCFKIGDKKILIYKLVTLGPSGWFW